MLLQLKQLFNRNGEKKDFSYAVPLEELGDYKAYGTFVTPVSIEGTVVNRAGVVQLNYTAKFTLHNLCDRCLDEFDREYEMTFDHVVVKSTASEDDEYEYVVCPDCNLELNELAISDLLLQLPTKTLCKDDCKGLCSKCGKNLNYGDCVCCE